MTLEQELVENIVDIVTTICDVSFNLPVSYQQEANLPEGKSYLSYIHIVGDWNGSVTIQTTEKLAKDTSKSIIGTAEDHTTEVYYIQQFMQELANMAAGNMKPLLGELCALSTPKCVAREGFDPHIPGCHKVKEFSFIAPEDQHMVVTLFVSEQNPKEVIQRMIESG